MKFRSIFPTLLLMTIVWGSYAQTKFRRVIGNTGYDYGYSVKQTADKGYIVGGSTTSWGAGNSDMYLVKTDSMGIPTMHKTYGGINIDRGTCIRQTSDSGYVFAGYTNSYGAGGYDIFVVRLDSTFNILWEKTYGGSDWDFGNCIEQTSDGGFIICGSTFSFGNGNEDYYLIKTNAAGDTLWTKTYGGSNQDVANSVVPTSDGGYILTGISKSLGDANGDFYTVKTNNLGDTLWTYRYGGSQLDQANAVIESSAGGYLIAGETKSFGAGSSDGILVKINNSGAYVLNYLMGDVGYDNIKSLCEKSDGKIDMVGTTFNYGGINGDVFEHIVRADFSFYNATTFGTLQEDFGYAVAPTQDNSFVLCGTTTGFNNGLEDIYLIKTDTNGLAGFTGSETNLVISGIEEHNVHNQPAIYPNPANERITVNFPASYRDIETEVRVLDIMGKEQKRIRLQHSLPFQLSTEELANGIYLLQFIQEGSCSSTKLIIQH